MIFITIITLLQPSTSFCVQCKLGGSFWTYDLSSLQSCPYGSRCSFNCSYCPDTSSDSTCLYNSSTQCPTRESICPGSYKSDSKGTFFYSIPKNTLCYWEFDLRDKITSGDSTKFLLDYSSSLDPTILFLVYSISNKSSRPSLSSDVSEMYSLNMKKITLTGNYFVLVFWHSSDLFEKFKYEYKITSDGSNHIDIILLVSVLVPCIFVSLCGLCIYSYWKRRSSIYRARVSYQIVSHSDLMNDSFVDNYFPIKYYLVNKDEVCPICFEQFKIGDEIRNTKCEHLFHARCLEEWIESRPLHYVCPMCKSLLFEFELSR